MDPLLSISEKHENGKCKQARTQINTINSDADMNMLTTMAGGGAYCKSW